MKAVSVFFKRETKEGLSEGEGSDHRSMMVTKKKVWVVGLPFARRSLLDRPNSVLVD